MDIRTHADRGWEVQTHDVGANVFVCVPRYSTQDISMLRVYGIFVFDVYSVQIRIQREWLNDLCILAGSPLLWNEIFSSGSFSGLTLCMCAMCTSVFFNLCLFYMFEKAIFFFVLAGALHGPEKRGRGSPCKPTFHVYMREIMTQLRRVSLLFLITADIVLAPSVSCFILLLGIFCWSAFNVSSSIVYIFEIIHMQCMPYGGLR